MFSLEAKRKELGFTQREMAEKLGLSIGGYCNIERKRYLPCIATAKIISNILGIGRKDIYD